VSLFLVLVLVLATTAYLGQLYTRRNFIVDRQYDENQFNLVKNKFHFVIVDKKLLFAVARCYLFIYLLNMKSFTKYKVSLNTVVKYEIHTFTNTIQQVSHTDDN